VQPAEYIPKYYPDVVWVTYVDSNREVSIDRPAIYGDTLRGTLGGVDSVAVLLGDVRSVRARMPDHTKTAFLVSGTVVGSVAAIYFLWASKAGSNTAGVYCGVDPDGRPYTSC
jgi:hypothetical protein